MSPKLSETELMAISDLAEIIGSQSGLCQSCGRQGLNFRRLKG